MSDSTTETIETTTEIITETTADATTERTADATTERTADKVTKKSVSKSAAGNQKFRALDVTYVAVCAALMAICSWIQIPMTIPITLQTFGVFLSVGVLGGGLGTLAVVIFVLLGAVGVPVFAGFSGGISVLLGPTGGYIIGFIFTGLLMWIIEHFFGRKIYVLAISMILGLFICYAFGTAWFMIMYAHNGTPIGLGTALGWCVFPYIPFDIAKIALALGLTKILRKAIKFE